MPALDHLLRAAQITIHDITYLVIATGPGSFTGLRVGFSVAKGICHGLNVPIIGVSGLEALASQLPLTRYPVCAMLRSRKHEVFTALFEWSSQEKLLRHTNDTCLSFEDLPGFLRGKTLFIGNDFNTQGPLIQNIMGDKALLAAAHLWNLKASAVGHIGLKRIEDQNYDHLRDLVPAYLRPPDIRPNPFPPLSRV